MPLKLVVDDKIPYVSDFFTSCDEIIYLPGEKITREDLFDADMLLTRTVTTVDTALLNNTAVKFVGTATTGTDHIDVKWLLDHHIAFATSAGANAQAVAEYMICCIAALIKQDKLHAHHVAGIIGCGRIGHMVATILQTLGFDVMCYDPLLTEKPDFNFVSLEQLISASDFISIHTPLTKTGLHSTFHMIDQTLLQQMKPNTVLCNTARGSVIDQTALLQTHNLTLCLDVWEHEPHISLELLHKAFIGTPHIAGYSIQAKYRATQMVYESAADFFGWPKKSRQENKVSHESLFTFLKSEWLEKALSVYNPLKHTEQMRDVFQNQTDSEKIKQLFIAERKKYPLRDSFKWEV
jgi:erythronate-4-phosphate dehydrogenase